MATIEEFEQHMRHTLVHFYDPSYQPDAAVWAALGCDPQNGLKSLWSGIATAIGDLKPDEHIPRTARVWRVYEVLACRYLQGLAQEECAVRFAITPRHLRREQQHAVGVLARRLWERRGAERTADGDGTAPRIQAQAAEAATPDDWTLQVRQELAALEHSAPGVVARIGEATRGVSDLQPALLAGRAIRLHVDVGDPELAVALHVSALRQILVVAIQKIARLMSSGNITVTAGRHGPNAHITVVGQPAFGEALPASDFIREAVATHGGSLHITSEGDRIAFEVELPTADKVTVLVVDDNAGLVHFLGRYVTGTRYELIHLAEGRRMFETIESIAPDIVVLDVMLPDIDGWELLTQLQMHSDTRDIPVVVCSVVRQENLALALGAARYLQKPVGRRQFIEALDVVSAGLL